jgi:carbon-monoxide dehydrogenase medium subunit
MRDGEKSPNLLVDISDVMDMAFVSEENGSIVIGAATTIAELASSAIVRETSPILASAAKQIGNPQTRNRATVGGNLVHASPCADTAPPLLVLDASVVIMSPGGESRDVTLHEFFREYKVTALGRGEVLTRVTFPKPKSTARGGYTKIGLRNAMSISVASIALMLEMDGGRCQKARVAAGSVAPVPLRACRVEQLLEGRQVSETLLEECSKALKKEISPICDIRGSDEYRSYVAGAILKRSIAAAMA